MFINVNVSHLVNQTGVDCKCNKDLFHCTVCIVYHFNTSLLHFAINRVPTVLEEKIQEFSRPIL